MTDVMTSKNGIPIRLTDERWAHIVEEHREMDGVRSEVLETIAQPERIVAGGQGELIAARETGVGKWLVVVYRELQSDGFAITAFFTRIIRVLDKRRHLWP